MRPVGPTLADLIEKAEVNGYSQADLITASRYYCNGKTDLERLSPEEIADLERRLSARIDKDNAARTTNPVPATPVAVEEEVATTPARPRTRQVR